MRARARALAVAGLLVAAGCGGEGGGTIGAGTSTSAGPGGIGTTAATSATTQAPPATTATTSPSADARYGRFGRPATVADGFLAGTSPDGSAVYVERVDDQLSQVGCEGFPEPLLFRVPLGGGQAEVVRSAAGEPVRGLLVRGPAGRVALVDGCEGFLQTLRVGTETADGRLTGLTRVPLADGAGFVGGFSWTPDGRRLVAGRTDFSRNVGTVVSVDPGTGALSPVFELDASKFVTDVAVLADGTYAVAGEGQVTLRDATGRIQSAVAGFGFAVAPDRGRVAAYGQGVQLLTPGRIQPVPLTAESLQVTGATFSHDGRAIAYLVGGEAGQPLRVVTLSDGHSAAVPEVGGTVVRPRFTGDDRALAFTTFLRPGEGATVQVVRLG